MNFWRQYAAASTLSGLPLVKAGEAGIHLTAPLASGDVKVSKDGGALANIGTLPTISPSGSGLLDITMSEAELTCKRLTIRFRDGGTIAWEDTVVIVETYGNAAAQHPAIGRAEVPLLAATQTTIDGIQTDLSNGVDGLGALKSLIETLDVVVDAVKLVTDDLSGKMPPDTLASSAEVTAISNTTNVRVVIPTVLKRPDSGSTPFVLDLYLYDNDGNMEAPDSLPTVTAKNQSGTDRSSNLGTVVLVSTGRYTVTYTVAAGHAIEQIRFEWSIVEGGVTKLHGASAQIVDTTAVDFTAADRVKLDTLHDTRLTAARASKLDNLDVASSTLATSEDAADIKGAGFDGNTDSLEALRDRGDAAWTTGAGGGGGTTVVLGPVVASREPGNRLSSPITLEMHQHEERTFDLTVLDAAGNPVSLADMTLRFSVFDNSDPVSGVFDVENADITKGGDNSEIAQVLVKTSQSASTLMAHRFALWSVSDNRVLAHGVFVVVSAVNDVT